MKYFEICLTRIAIVTDALEVGKQVLIQRRQRVEVFTFQMTFCIHMV